MVRKLRSRRRRRRITKTEADSDKDFVVGENDYGDDSESGGTSEDSFSSSEDEEYREEGEKAVRIRSEEFSKHAGRKHNYAGKKNKKGKIPSFEEDDFDYDVDDDDDEFSIHDINCQKESPVVSTRRGMRRKCHTKKRRRTTNSTSFGRRRRAPMVVRRKVAQSGDGRFKNGYPVFRETRRQYLGGRNSGFDSDNSSSGSSDYEFTISEEEREQVKEARMFCHTFRDEWFSNRKRHDSTVAPPRTFNNRRKGKEKVDENGTQIMNTCGICLTEEGNRTIAGALNSCSHYFCFSCIFEWSKIESRCPLCKQRFKTITKHSGTMTNVQNATIHVPERNQVYHQSEEYVDPYEDMVCGECQLGEDEDLMLLCDLCDSSAHTYCVGLGREVPEGNWYCEGCRPVVHGSSNSQPRSPCCEVIEVDTPPQVTDSIVHDSDDPHSPEQIRMCLSSRLMNYSAPSVENPTRVSPITVSEASTVARRRRIHRQIRHLNSNIRTTDTLPIIEDFTTSNNVSNSQIHRVPVLERGVSDSHNSSQNGGLSSMRGPLVADSTLSTDCSFSHVMMPQANHMSSNSVSGHLREADCLLPGIGSTGERGMFHMEKKMLQLVVKRDLMNLSNGKLGRDKFKEIAKRSTHAVMASCGLEQRALDRYTVDPPAACSHRGIEPGGGMSVNLSRDCCSGCFMTFVRGVVKRTMTIVLMEMEV